MKKVLPATVLLCLSLSCASAMQIHVAPISVVDAVDDSLDRTANAQRDLIGVIDEYFSDAQIEFKSISADSVTPPQSVLDAITLCRNEKADYLLYGVVTRKEHTVQAEVKLFDSKSKTILRVFYSIDDRDSYDRMMADLASKICGFLDSAFGVGLRIADPEKSYRRFLVPISLGFWTMVDSDWSRAIIGTAGLSSGLEFIPNDRMIRGRGLVRYPSVSVDVSYRYGFGQPSMRQANLHSVGIAIPIRLYTRLKNGHSFFFGAGPLYGIEILNYTAKYEDAITYAYQGFGLMASLGYAYDLSEKIRIGIDNIVDVRLYESSMITYQLRLGVGLLINKEERRAE